MNMIEQFENTVNLTESIMNTAAAGRHLPGNAI